LPGTSQPRNSKRKHSPSTPPPIPTPSKPLQPPQPGKTVNPGNAQPRVSATLELRNLENVQPCTRALNM